MGRGEQKLTNEGYSFCDFEYEDGIESAGQRYMKQGYDVKFLREKSDTRGLKMYSIWTKPSDNPTMELPKGYQSVSYDWLFEGANAMKKRANDSFEVDGVVFEYWQDDWDEYGNYSIYSGTCNYLYIDIFVYDYGLCYWQVVDHSSEICASDWNYSGREAAAHVAIDCAMNPKDKWNRMVEGKMKTRKRAARGWKYVVLYMDYVDYLSNDYDEAVAYFNELVEQTKDNEYAPVLLIYSPEGGLVYNGFGLEYDNTITIKQLATGVRGEVNWHTSSRSKRAMNKCAYEEKTYVYDDCPNGYVGEITWIFDGDTGWYSVKIKRDGEVVERFSEWSLDKARDRMTEWCESHGHTSSRSKRGMKKRAYYGLTYRESFRLFDDIRNALDDYLDDEFSDLAGGYANLIYDVRHYNEDMNYYFNSTQYQRERDGETSYHGEDLNKYPACHFDIVKQCLDSENFDYSEDASKLISALAEFIAGCYKTSKMSVLRGWNTEDYSYPTILTGNKKRTSSKSKRGMKKHSAWSVHEEEYHSCAITISEYLVGMRGYGSAFTYHIECPNSTVIDHEYGFPTVRDALEAARRKVDEYCEIYPTGSTRKRAMKKNAGGDWFCRYYNEYPISFKVDDMSGLYRCQIYENEDAKEPLADERGFVDYNEMMEWVANFIDSCNNGHFGSKRAMKKNAAYIAIDSIDIPLVFDERFTYVRDEVGVADIVLEYYDYDDVILGRDFKIRLMEWQEPVYPAGWQAEVFWDNKLLLDSGGHKTPEDALLAVYHEAIYGNMLRLYPDGRY